MKIKLISKGNKLPNCWKSCGASLEDWKELHSGKAIEVPSVPEHLENLVKVIKSPQKKGIK